MARLVSPLVLRSAIEAGAAQNDGASLNSVWTMETAMFDVNTTPRGFEPLRAEPNGFLVHLLSHSDTVSCAIRHSADLNCKILLDAHGVPLSWSPLIAKHGFTNGTRGSSRPFHSVQTHPRQRISCLSRPLWRTCAFRTFARDERNRGINTSPILQARLLA